MYADDVFRKDLATVITKLASWADGLSDTGKIETREGKGFWSIAARPATAGACPVTLVLRSDQKFDLSLGDQRFEDRSIDDFSLFPALVEAVSDGRVERRTTSCAVTGAPLALETRVLLSGGKTWSEYRGQATGPGDAVIEETARYLPYRRHMRI